MEKWRQRSESAPSTNHSAASVHDFALSGKESTSMAFHQAKRPKKGLSLDPSRSFSLHRSIHPPFLSSSSLPPHFFIFSSSHFFDQPSLSLLYSYVFALQPPPLPPSPPLNPPFSGSALRCHRSFPGLICPCPPPRNDSPRLLAMALETKFPALPFLPCRLLLSLRHRLHLVWNEHRPRLRPPAIDPIDPRRSLRLPDLHHIPMFHLSLLLRTILRASPAPRRIPSVAVPVDA